MNWITKKLKQRPDIEKEAKELAGEVLKVMDINYGRMVAHLLGVDTAGMSNEELLGWAEVGKKAKFPDECPECGREYND